MGVLPFFRELDSGLLLMPFKIASLLALCALMNLAVRDGTQLCFTWMVARAGLMDVRKFQSAPTQPGLAQPALFLAQSAGLSGSFES